MLFENEKQCVYVRKQKSAFATHLVISAYVMPANEWGVYYDHDFESLTTLNLLIELVTLVLIIFAGIYINYKRRQRDERADETVPTSAEADKQIGR